ACLLPADPLRQTWNVFRMFGIEYKETRWTQWLAAILRHDNGSRCARIAWGAFCDAVARRAEIRTPSGSLCLADHAHWRTVAREIPRVEDEVPDGKLGQLDL